MSNGKPPMGKTSARKLAETVDVRWVGYEEIDEEKLTDDIEKVINIACRKVLDLAADCGNGIVVRSAEATNLVTTIQNRILELKKRYADVKGGR